MQTIDDGRPCPGQRAKGLRRCKWIGYPNVMTDAIHDGDDFIRDVAAPDAAKRAG